MVYKNFYYKINNLCYHQDDIALYLRFCNFCKQKMCPDCTYGQGFNRPHQRITYYCTKCYYKSEFLSLIENV